MIDTAGSISGASKALKENGALDVYCVATHPVFSGNAIENLEAGGFKEIIVTNTIPKKEGAKRLQNLTVLSVSSLFAEAIRRIHNGESVSCLFD
jgi:ribose-phosphate pyrophosphokinase